MEKNPGFHYVYIPCDGSQIEERFFKGECQLESDGFQEEIKSHFAAGNAIVDQKMLKQQMTEHAQKMGQSIENMDDSVLQGLMNSTSIELFPALLPLADTKFRGITVYIDNKGVSKNLQRNDRLTGIIQSAGYRDQIFYGDAFISSMFDDQDAWYRIDFRKSEFTSDAEWIKMALRQTSNKQGPQQFSNLLKPGAGASSPAMQNLSIDGQGSNQDIETDTYIWRDVDKEEIEINFKAACTKQEVKVNFKIDHLTVALKGEKVFDEKLLFKVIPDECSWSVTDKKLCVTLMKSEERTWSSLTG